jgi:CAAX prenyl protease-like protein
MMPMPDSSAPKTRVSEFLPYVVPFIVFAGFTYLVPVFNLSKALVYPAKTLSVTALLFFYWPRVRHEIKVTLDLNAVLAGIAVFIIWVGFENLYHKIGSESGFNPFELAQGPHAYLLIASHLFGAVVVFPVMDELFWRSFALRFLINTNFTRYALGTFTWFSFVFVSIAFGLENQRWLPGIFAGLIYAMLLYQKKNLFSPILAHGVANFLIGVYVIVNNEWGFW